MALILSGLLAKIIADAAKRIKESLTLEIFERNVTSIRTFDCSCKFCKNIVSNLGSLQLDFCVHFI